MKIPSKIPSRELRILRIEREAHRWRRIANHLYDALTNPDATDQDRADAIEHYLNYAHPTHDDD